MAAQSRNGAEDLAGPNLNAEDKSSVGSIARWRLRAAHSRNVKLTACRRTWPPASV